MNQKSHNHNNNKPTRKETQKSKGIVKNLTLIFGAAAIFLAGSVYGAGSVFSHPTSPFARIVNQALGQPGDVDFNLFWEVYGRIQKDYPQDFNNQDILYGSIKGAVSSLGDRHSLFLTPSESKRFFESIRSEFAGIGAELSQEDGVYVIVSPLKDTPSERAGLQSRDIILAVDDVDSDTMQFNELINNIRGEKGTSVTLKIMREGFDEPRDFRIQRDIIHIDTLQYELLDNDHGYVRVFQFSDDTTEEFIDAVDELIEMGAKDLILDLRNNPGGILKTGVDLASLFIDEGIIVSEVRKDDETVEIRPTVPAKYKDLNLVVLVNGGSASASEIVAGAIQDANRGKIIGDQTFGKGSVQAVQNLSDGSALKITTAQWRTPKGRFIEGEGITPDISVEYDLETDKDEQLEAAIRELE